MYAEMAVFLYRSGHSLSPLRQSPMLVGFLYTVVMKELVLGPLVVTGVLGMGGALPTVSFKFPGFWLVLEVVFCSSRCRLV